MTLIKKLVITFLLVAPFVYAYYHKPLLDKHREKIYSKAAGEEAAADQAVYDLPQWGGLEFSDMLIVTATRDKSIYSMVSIGMLDHVLVMDTDWAPKAFKLKP